LREQHQHAVFFNQRLYHIIALAKLVLHILSIFFWNPQPNAIHYDKWDVFFLSVSVHYCISNRILITFAYTNVLCNWIAFLFYVCISFPWNTVCFLYGVWYCQRFFFWKLLLDPL